MADRVEIDAGAIVLDPEHELGGLRFNRDADFPLSRLACFLALGGLLDAMRDGIAQHVLQRRGNPFQNVPVELVAAARHLEFQAAILAGFTRRGADQAAQARRYGAERHHAGLHQAFLQFGAESRLLGQQCLGIAGRVVEQFLQVQEIGNRLGEAPGELLHGRKAVEFKRIESFRAFFPRILVAGTNLGFGLDLQFPELFPQAPEGCIELAQVRPYIADLAFETAAENIDFTG